MKPKTEHMKKNLHYVKEKCGSQIIVLGTMVVVSALLVVIVGSFVCLVCSFLSETPFKQQDLLMRSSVYLWVGLTAVTAIYVFMFLAKEFAAFVRAFLFTDMAASENYGERNEKEED